MPAVNDTTTHSASNNGNPTGSYSAWSISPGSDGVEWIKVSGGNSGDTSVQITWLVAGTYIVATTASNTCSSLPGSQSVIVTANCSPITNVTITG